MSGFRSTVNVRLLLDPGWGDRPLGGVKRPIGFGPVPGFRWTDSGRADAARGRWPGGRRDRRGPGHGL